MNQIDRTISFRQDMIDLIIAGKKTVTIRPIKQQLEVFFHQDTKLYTWQGHHELRRNQWIEEQCPYAKTFKIIPIKDHDGLLLDITDVWFERLENLTDQVWGADGLSDLSEISRVRHWDSFYGETEYKWTNFPWVWIIEFELIEEKGQEDE